MKCHACKIEMDYVEIRNGTCHLECAICHSYGSSSRQDDLPRVRLNKPLRKSYTRQELIEEAMAWVRDRYQGDERYHILGLLVDFVTDMHDKETKK